MKTTCASLSGAALLMAVSSMSIAACDAGATSAADGMLTAPPSGGAAAAAAASKRDIPVADVPQNVIDAAIAAVPGSVVKEAAVETNSNGEKTYELDVMVGNTETEVRITEAGTVISVNEQDGEDADNNDGDSNNDDGADDDKDDDDDNGDKDDDDDDDDNGDDD